jgi:hypothetical protein
MQHNISYKHALRDASPSYKTRNEVKPEVVIPKQEEPTKPKRKSNTKVVENITLKF